MEGKISHSGLLARSPEGHAARGMQIKGNEDVWVEIQANTFRNWVNEHLPQNLRVADLSQDLCTGVSLCALVEALRGRPLKPSWNRRPANQHHYLENVTTALNAIEQDGVKLVNIGNVDIVNGNLKLILGLIWSLIVRYQIGRSKFPPRKLMLAWLQAVLPECRVSNLTTDWNSGVLLSALVDYCRPGLFPHWRQLDKNDHINNCRKAMDIAQRDLGIPAVLEPEYLASPWLDELSGMTYLSYFMKPGSPGFHATLRWVNSRLERPINNFTSDWNDGRVISEVIRSLGGSATAPEKLRVEQQYWESNLTQAVEAGKRLGVQPVLSAKDMADTHVEHLGVMAYAAHFQWVPERPPLHDLINVTLNSTSGRVGEPTHFQVTLLDSSLSYSNISVDVRGPDNKLYTVKNLKQGRGSFIPQRVGMHELVVKYENEEIISGHYFRVLPLLVEVAPPGMAPCALGSLVQVLVNATGAPRREDILVTAYSPTGRPLDCPLTTFDGTNSATFKPDEAGEWRIEITYQGKQIQGGPFTCSVFDPNGVHVSGLEGALPLVPHSIELDCRDVGVPGEVCAEVVHDKRSVHCRVEKVDASGFHYRVHFTPMDAGKHRLYVYFNGYDVKGSPFMMRVGTQKRSKSSSSPSPNSTYRQSPSRYSSSSPINHVKSYSTTTTGYRQNASPVNETHKFAQEYHKSLAEKRLTAESPNFERTSSPSYLHRQSPSYLQRTQSPSYLQRTSSPSYNRSDSPDYISSRRLNEKRFDTPSPSFTKNYENSYTSKMSSMRITDTRSPNFMERASPDVGGYSSSRYDKRVTESRSYNSSFDQNGVDTSPIVKVSAMADQSSRRDSWDAIAKTRNMLSERSLESVANLTDAQLDADLRRRKIEEHNRIFNEEQHSFQKFSNVEMDRYGRSSPIRIRSTAGGASSVKVQPVPDGVLGQPVEFEIDGSGAGSGDLEILVEGGRVTSSVRSLGGQRFKAAFTPHQALPHRVDIKFNSETVPGCEVSIATLEEPAPLVLYPSNFTYVYPSPDNLPEDQNIYLKPGDTLLATCPNTILTEFNHSTIYATCNEDGMMVVDDEKLLFFTLKCNRALGMSVRNTTRMCATNAEIIEMGYLVGVGLKWLPLLEVCFDAEARNTLYTKFLMPKAIRYREFLSSDITDQDNIYNLPISGRAIYLSSKSTINEQVGLPITSDKYMNLPFYRTRLTTETEVFYPSQDKIVSMALNTFPEWAKHCYNWMYVDDVVQKYGIKHVKDLEVYTGTHGTVTVLHEQTFEKVTLHLYVGDDGFKAMPVPALIWKLVYEPIQQLAVVFLTVNVPYETFYEEHIICDDISDQVPWQPFEQETMRNFSCGYSYVCSYEDFASKVNYAPKLDVLGLLV